MLRTTSRPPSGRLAACKASFILDYICSIFILIYYYLWHLSRTCSSKSVSLDLLHLEREETKKSFTSSVNSSGRSAVSDYSTHKGNPDSEINGYKYFYSKKKEKKNLICLHWKHNFKYHLVKIPFEVYRIPKDPIDVWTTISITVHFPSSSLPAAYLHSGLISSRARGKY